MIADASPLIILSKMNKLSLLKELFSHVNIPEQVRDEVLFDNKPGSIAIKRAIQEGWIHVINCDRNPVYGLGKGEEAALYLAKKRGEKFLTDDKSAIQIAKVLNVPAVRTSSVIILAVSKKLIIKNEAIAIIDAMIKVGQYIGSLDYSRIRKVIDDIPP